MTLKSEKPDIGKIPKISIDLTKRESAAGRFLAQKSGNSSFKGLMRGKALSKERVEKVGKALEKAGKTTGSFEGRRAR